MVMLSRRVPPRVPPALEHEAKARGITVGALIDRLCERANFYTTPTVIAEPTEVPDDVCGHEYDLTPLLAYDHCIHCGHKRWHRTKPTTSQLADEIRGQ